MYLKYVIFFNGYVLTGFDLFVGVVLSKQHQIMLKVDLLKPISFPKSDTEHSMPMW